MEGKTHVFYLDHMAAPLISILAYRCLEWTSWHGPVVIFYWEKYKKAL
jgi:hypothetical protein